MARPFQPICPTCRMNTKVPKQSYCADCMARYRRRRYVAAGSTTTRRRIRVRRPYESFQTRAEREAVPLILEPGVAGYIAGILDGEGAICLGKRTGARAGNRRGLRTVVGNTSRDMLAWLQQHLGGILRLGLPGTNGHKPVWYYELSAIESRRLLRAILPLLVVKRRHAEVVLAYHEAATVRDSMRMADLCAEIDRLNRKGPPQ